MISLEFRGCGCAFAAVSAPWPCCSAISGQLIDFGSCPHITHFIMVLQPVRVSSGKRAQMELSSLWREIQHWIAEILSCFSGFKGIWWVNLCQTCQQVETWPGLQILLEGWADGAPVFSFLLIHCVLEVAQVCESVGIKKLKACETLVIKCWRFCSLNSGSYQQSWSTSPCTSSAWK